MAIIYSYPTVDPVREDLILGTDVSSSNKATKNFTIQSIIDLVTVATGDLQTVLALGNVATGFDIDLTNSSFIGGGFRTTGGIVISGTTGIGFTNLTSTAFTGTIATAAQPNITSLGSLTALVLDGPISGTNLITSSNLAGAQNDNVVSTLAIKTYVDNQVGLFDTLAEVLANGNTTGANNIVVSATADITFTDTSKALFGSGQDLEINNDGIDSFITDLSTGDLRLRSDDAVKIQASTGGNTLATFTKGAGVDLYFNNNKKIETLAGGAKVTGAFEATTSGTFASLVNAGTYTAGNGVGTAGQILSSTATGTSWVTEVPLYNWSLEGTAIPSGAAVTVTDGANITTTWDAANYDLSIAVTGLPDGTGAANQVTFWSDTDTLTGAAGFVFAGGATGQVTVAGILQAGTLSDGTFSGSAGTYTGGVSITSTDFVGALTGNADTATALASSGAIAITGDTTSTGGPYTYTSGGAISIATTIADTTVTAKVLTNLATPTSSAIAATDTILAAMAKLQGQITGLAGSLAFEGTWDASTGNPPSATPLNGQFWIVSVAGNTNLDGITDWLVGDWAIYVNNGAGTDAWQKLDQSNEVLGSGAANKIAKWTSTNTLATGLIDDDGTTVTVGNSGNLIVEGNTTLGDADTDTTTVKGPAIFEFATRFNEGISLGAATYGTAGQVLTSGGGSASVNTWTTPTTGVVESISGLYGITVAGTAAIPTIAITADANNLIKLATVKTTPVGADTILINDSAATDVLKQVTLTSLKTFTSENWILSDGTNTTTIADGDTATFAGASGITVAESSGTITITGSAQPGTGTQYTLPVWSTTTSLGDSMVSQNSGGTELTVSGSATFGGTVYIPSKLEHTGDSDTFLNFSDNTITLSAGGSSTTFSGSGNATFGGNITFGDSHFIGDDSFDNLLIQSSSGENLNLSSANDVIFYTGGTAPNALGTQRLRIFNSNGSATFAGQVNVGINLLMNNNKEIRWLDSGGAERTVLEVDSNDDLYLGKSGGGNLYLVNGTSYTTAVTIDSSQNATFAGNVEIDGDLTVDGSIIHGNGKSGIFNGRAATNNSTVDLFKITRTGNSFQGGGQLIFDVFATSELAGGGVLKYTVAHAFNQTPLYNKIIDYQGTNTMTLAFTNSTSSGGTTGDSVLCQVTTNSTQNISYTVQVGYSFANTVVVS